MSKNIKRILLVIGLAILALLLVGGCSSDDEVPLPVAAKPVVTAPAAPAETLITVRAGDTLSGLVGYQNAPTVCSYNRLRDCDLIQPGQTLRVPVNVTVSAAPARDAEGWRHWQNVGGAPLNKHCGSPEKRFQAASKLLGLSEAEKAELWQQVKDRKGVQESVKNGFRYATMTFCRGGKVDAISDMVLDDPDTIVVATRYSLSTGRVIHEVNNCGNWAEPSKSQASTL